MTACVARLSCVLVGTVLACFPLSSVAQPATTQSMEMNATEYGKFLDRLQGDLVSWESLLQRIDPGKNDPSYSVGKRIADNKAVALMHVSTAREFAEREKQKRTVYGEFVVGRSLMSLWDDVYELVQAGAFNDKSVEDVGGYSKEISLLGVQLMNDAINRVKSLESAQCVDVFGKAGSR